LVKKMRATVLLMAMSACVPRTKIVVPPEAAREWAYMPSDDGRSQRHVIRMSDGTRDWEVEFPDVAVGYEVRIPLRGAPTDGTTDDRLPSRLTAADRELMEERALERTPSADRAAGADHTTQPAVAAGPKKPDSKRPRGSYLGGIARVRELYRTRNYELALIDCVDLEREYPNDAKLLAMKGSIYRKLGKNRLARETWEKALALDPDNQTVADALRELAGEEEEGR
jgi:hypothetical protein